MMFVKALNGKRCDAGRADVNRGQVPLSRGEKLVESNAPFCPYPSGSAGQASSQQSPSDASCYVQYEDEVNPFSQSKSQHALLKELNRNPVTMHQIRNRAPFPPPSLSKVFIR